MKTVDRLLFWKISKSFQALIHTFSVVGRVLTKENLKLSNFKP